MTQYPSKNITLPDTAEFWTEIRCPACMTLGWQSSRLLLKMKGKPTPQLDVIEQFKCHRCKSIVEWVFGAPVLIVVQYGVKCHKRQTVAFE